MTILETFIKLRDDLKLWVTNNLNQKANISYVDEKFDSITEFDPTEIQEAIDANTAAIDTKVDKVEGKGLSTNDYTTAEKDKLATVEANANFYEHPVHDHHDSGLYKITVDTSGHVSGATLAEKEDIVALGLPAQDTTYDTEIEDLSDRIDGVEDSINTTNETLNGVSQELESYKTTNNEAVATNSTGIEANKSAIEAIQGDYLTSTDKTQLQDDISQVSEKATANASAIEVLNGEGDGSIKQSIDNAFNEFAANVTNDEVVNTYKELIDYAATHNAEFTTLVGEVDTVKTDVGELETSLSDYKTVVSDQFTEVDTTVNNHVTNLNNPHGVTKEQLGLANVDNTSDVEKPISNATQEALDNKADAEHEHNDLYYTKDEILDSITVEDIDEICEFTSGGEGLVSVATEEWVQQNYQPKGNYAVKTEIPSIDGLATETYVDNKIATIPTPDVSGQINAHNTSESAHSDIRQSLSDAINDLTTKIEDAGSIDIDLNGSNEGEANPINANTLDGIHASQYAKVSQTTPRNLLDNSNFANPVNQRGQTSYTALGYTIDRWYIGNNNGNVVLEDDGIRIKSKTGSTVYVYQFIENGVLEEGKEYTVAACLDDGTIAITSAAVTTDMTEAIVDFANGNIRISYHSDRSVFNIIFSTSDITGFKVKWVALYEGNYTEDTLPKYQPKGFAAELLECARYFTYLWDFSRWIPVSRVGNYAFISLSTPVPMRVTPSINTVTWEMYGPKLVWFTASAPDMVKLFGTNVTMQWGSSSASSWSDANNGNYFARVSASLYLTADL